MVDFDQWDTITPDTSDRVEIQDGSVTIEVTSRKCSGEGWAMPKSIRRDGMELMAVLFSKPGGQRIVGSELRAGDIVQITISGCSIESLNGLVVQARVIDAKPAKDCNAQDVDLELVGDFPAIQSVLDRHTAATEN